MVEVDWGNPLNRTFEQGIERVMVYTNDLGGEPWHGVSRIEEKKGINVKKVHNEGILVSVVPLRSEVELSIEAYSEPKILKQCMGSKILPIGITVSSQRQKPFDLTYRTYVGNGIDDQNFYKIHFVYNSICLDPGSNHSTMSRSSEPGQRTYEIHTVPEFINGLAPSSHLVVDTSMVSIETIRDIENILYGSETSSPTMIRPEELMDMLSSETP